MRIPVSLLAQDYCALITVQFARVCQAIFIFFYSTPWEVVTDIKYIIVEVYKFTVLPKPHLTLMM